MKEKSSQPDLQVDADRLRQFERALDPRHPQRSTFPVRVLGYGEISTVLEIDLGRGGDLAYKRMPMFKTGQEAEAFAAVYHEYLQILQERVGLRVVPGDILQVVDETRGRVVAYIVQKKLDPATIGNSLIHQLSPAQTEKLVLAVLRETAKVFDFNLQHKGELEVAIDGQISNWTVIDFDPASPRLDGVQLAYFDTSSPFLTRDGKEQLDAELFLRSAPSFLTWILRLFFLEDVMTRYYDFRKVCIDLIANFYKEQRPDLVPELVTAVNGFLAAREEGGDFKPLSVEEIRSYYREDALIWMLYLAFRKVDRALHRLLGKYYPYILPDRVKR